MARLEQLFGAVFRGVPTIPKSQAGITSAFAGIASINSNAASVTVNCTVVQSDSVIFALPRLTTAVASGSGVDVICTTIAPGSSFVLGTADGQPIISSSVTPVMWAMFRT